MLIKKGWEIIPIENFLAISKGELGLEITYLEEAQLATGILERGVDFIVVLPEAKNLLKKIVNEIKIFSKKNKTCTCNSKKNNTNRIRP